MLLAPVPNLYQNLIDQSRYIPAAAAGGAAAGGGAIGGLVGRFAGGGIGRIVGLAVTVLFCVIAIVCSGVMQAMQ